MDDKNNPRDASEDCPGGKKCVEGSGVEMARRVSELLQKKKIHPE